MFGINKKKDKTYNIKDKVQDILNPNDLVCNYKKVLDFVNEKSFPIMRWEDNFLDEDIWANNITVLDNFHKSLKYCFIDYPLDSYKVELYCDKKCKLLFNDLYSSYNNCLTHDKYPNDIVKYSVKLNNKIIYKTMSIKDCVFTLKKIND